MFYILIKSMGYSDFCTETPRAIHANEEVLKKLAIAIFKKEEPQFARYPFWEEGSNKLPPGYAIRSTSISSRDMCLPHIQRLIKNGE